MCGICGFLDTAGAVETHAYLPVVRAMADALAHRGPDDRGEWASPADGIALGHTRLSILDLSPAGHQPMRSASARYTIVFNGEIYNHKALRKELSAKVTGWRGHSDTEVMLAAFDAWGVSETLKRLTGMFALALWDAKDKVLHLARDRLGEKPLYYGWIGRTLLFASELKSLRQHPAWRGSISRDAIAAYLRHNYVPAPYSIYQGISKLPPGHCISIGATAQALPAAYWSLRRVAEEGVAAPTRMDEREATDELERLLRDSVAMQMIADVPVGVFLSGGIDSSTVTAVMQAQASRPVKSFSIGFDSEAYDEAPYAKAVAQHLGTEHTELYVEARQALAVIPQLAHTYDEPFSDSSQIPTMLLAGLARRSVKVALSGDGGDELFGGYVRYFWGRRIWGKIKPWPRALRRFGAQLLGTLTPEQWDALLARLPAGAACGRLGEIRGERMRKLSEVLCATTPEDLYYGLVSHWPRPDTVVRGSREPTTILTDRAQWPNVDDATSRMMFLDTSSYLPDDILVKVDRATMAVGLEARVPLLDHRLVEFAWRVPLHMKIRDNKGKWLLRQVLERYVPRSLIDRPKAGFAVPLETWLRGPLRAWADELLDARRLRDEGFFEPEPIVRRWSEHKAGTFDWQYWLWDVLMFQEWYEHQRTHIEEPVHG